MTESRERYESGEWRDQSACRGIADNSESFYPFYGPPGEGSTSKDIRIRIAMSYCGSCMVRAECLEYALGQPDNDGVWGGMEETERRSLRRRLRRSGA